MPGGRVEAGEMLAEAVVRELAEETAIEGVCDSLIGWVERIGDAWHHVIFDFSVTLLDEPGQAIPQAGGDATEARWVPLGDVADLRLVDGLVEFLHDHGILALIA